MQNIMHLKNGCVRNTGQNKKIGKSFSKNELLFLYQASSSSDSSKIWILQFIKPRASLSVSPSLTHTQSLSNLTLGN